MNMQQVSTESLMPLVGDCEVVLRSSVNYEPPMYLFPELLPKVPEGTAALSVSDAVSDAVDVEASSLNIAELFHVSHIKSKDDLQGRDEGLPMSPENIMSPVPRTSLASLLASNRLQVAGLTPEMLQRGKFSSGSIVEELLKLKDRAGLSVDESKAIMSNHFINLLAWRTLVEVNSQTPLSVKKEHRGEVADEGDEEAEEERRGKGARPGWRGGSGSLHVRSPHGDTEGEIDLGALRPSEDPWSSDIDLEPGTFVAAAERNVERRIELIDTLSSLYRRPWRTMQSRGIQTDRVSSVAINQTTPYADPARLPGAFLNPEDLGWKPRTEDAPNHYYWTLCIKSTTITSASQVVPMGGRFMHFGRSAGVTSAANGGIRNIHVGLSTFTTHPEFLSTHHFSLAVLSEKPTQSRDDTSTLSAPHASTPTADTNGEKRRSLWLMNYGRNGTRVLGKCWSLGALVRLDIGDILQPTDDIRISVSGPLSMGDRETKTAEVLLPQTAAGGTIKLETDLTSEE